MSLEIVVVPSSTRSGGRKLSSFVASGSRAAQSRPLGRFGIRPRSNSLAAAFGPGRRIAVPSARVFSVSMSGPTKRWAGRTSPGSCTRPGTACAAAQPLSRALFDFVVDPFVAAERAETNDDLLVHYQSPLISGDDVILESKGGTWLPCDLPG